MSFWIAWKERLNWLRDSGIGSLPRLIGRGVAASGAILVVLFGMAYGYRAGPDLWDWLQGGSDGIIIVNSPTVYTRQRLVNDRLSQTTWLQDQLKAADSNNFRSVDQLYRNDQNQKVAVRGGAGNSDLRSSQETTDSDNQKRDQTQKQESIPVQPLLVQTTTPAEFRAKNLYRDEVRAEITQTQLDDRHDIRGNTIYRLAFDATVIPGSRRDRLAGVRITLSHKALRAAAENLAPSLDRANFDPLYKQDYVDLYSEWLRYMQGQVTTSVENISTSISSGNHDPKTRQSLAQFLLTTICSYKVRIEDLSVSDGIILCDPEGPRYDEAVKNRQAAQKLIEDRIKFHSKIREEKAKQEFLNFIEYILGKEADTGQDNVSKKQRADRYYQQARLFCRRGNQRDFYLPTFFSELYPLFVTKPGEPSKLNPKMECPYFYDTPGERLRLGVVVYGELIRLLDTTRDKGGGLSDIARELERNSICPAQGRDGTEDQALCWFVEMQAAARCFAADYIKANLDRFSVRGGVEPWHRIQYFLRLEAIGRESGECNLLVSETVNPEATIEELKYILNDKTEAFAYSVTPKNFTENVSTASEMRDSFELLARFGNSVATNVEALASQMRQRSIQMQAVLAHPVVIGFGSGVKAPEVIQHSHSSRDDPLFHSLNTGRGARAIREVEVGWVIAPRMRERGFEQIDNQYSLTTVVSVPSWWRTVELDIEFCWLPRTRMVTTGGSNSVTSTICEASAKLPSKKAVVRLPGAIQELSRKLGFDIVQEPFLSDNPLQVLEIGQPGSLLLRGQRLWRSTEVTLGAQRASNIVVLSNMDGIIAEFKCVLPQLTQTGYDKRPIWTSAFVWTSEGVTTGAPVVLLWPGQNADPQGTAQEKDASNDDGASGKAAPGSTSVAKNGLRANSGENPARTNSAEKSAKDDVASQMPGGEPGRGTAAVKRREIWCPELFPKDPSQSSDPFESTKAAQRRTR